MQTPEEISVDGWISSTRHVKSPFFNERPNGAIISLLVIHNISLPQAEFGNGYVEQLFTGCLDCSSHQSFSDLEGLEVSSHFFIDRNGQVNQFVSTLERAWHAGVSCFNGVENCNDFSLGIELEGTDDLPYTEEQYKSLVSLSRLLIREYEIPINNIVGHCHIAPGRKTDPGESFDWKRYRSALGA